MIPLSSLASTSLKNGSLDLNTPAARASVISITEFSCYSSQVGALYSATQSKTSNLMLSFTSPAEHESLWKLKRKVTEINLYMYMYDAGVWPGDGIKAQLYTPILASLL